MGSSYSSDFKQDAAKLAVESDQSVAQTPGTLANATFRGRVLRGHISSPSLTPPYPACPKIYLESPCPSSMLTIPARTGNRPRSFQR